MQKQYNTNTRKAIRTRLSLSTRKMTTFNYGSSNGEGVKRKWAKMFPKNIFRHPKPIQGHLQATLSKAYTPVYYYTIGHMCNHVIV